MKRRTIQKVLAFCIFLLAVKYVSVISSLCKGPGCSASINFQESLFLSKASFMTRQRISPACQPTLPTEPIRRIHFAHMLRAGGVVLKHYLSKVARIYNLQLVGHEAGPDELPGTRNDTLYITHLRDPVDRSLSQFEYEGRWSCKDLKRANFVPTPKNANSLEDWIRTDFQGSKTWFSKIPTGEQCQFRTWLCSSNCYLKWFNWKSGRCVRELDRPAYLETAIHRLYSHHLIVDNEKLLLDLEYGKSLEEFFGVPGLVGAQGMRMCTDESKRANAKYPLKVPETLLAQLRDRNRLDYQIYNELMTCPKTSLPRQMFADAVDSTPTKTIPDPAVHHSGTSFRKPREKHGRSSPVCTPRMPPEPVKRILFTHMPMAESAAVERFFKLVSHFHGIELDIEEYGSSEAPGTRNDTFYVTHMSDPVQRSLRHWSCFDLRRRKTFTPTLEIASTFENWVRSDFQNLRPVSKLGGMNCTSKMRLCSTNCYIKWLNWKRGRCVREIDNYVNRTMDRLYQYHIIIDEERLARDPEYGQRLEQFFGAPSGLVGTKPASLCSLQANSTNAQYPLNVPKDLLEVLRDRNRLDYVVYNQLMSCTDSGFVDKTLSGFVAPPEDERSRSLNTDVDRFIAQLTSEFEARTSPACQPKPPPRRVKRIVFTHMRKAGGTTLRRYFIDVETIYNIPVVVHEAGAEELPGADDDTLYVTHMRNPVERSLSHFKYDGRWNCDNLQDPFFRPTLNNANSLERWVRTEFQGSLWLNLGLGFPTSGLNCRYKMWECSANCYIKWLNFESGKCVHELEKYSFVENAMEILFNYHLIIDVKKISSDSEYGEQLERFFGVPGLVDRHINARCDVKSKKANARFPLNVSEELMTELQDRNRLDQAVYTEVMSCAETVFPKQTLADAISVN